MIKIFDRTLGWALVLSGFAFAIWKCQFGLDLTDEAFYLAPAWKLFALGDKPFLDEVYNGPRQSDLLNYILIRPLVPFSILSLRMAAIVCYGSILLSLIYISFRKSFGLMAGMVFYICLTYDPFNMPTWSYNWWARNFFLLHHMLLLLAFNEANGKRRAWLWGGGWGCYGFSGGLT